MKISWKKYIEKTSINAPRPFLVEALQYVEDRNCALDLGAGALVDSVFLLSEGFEKVTALDADDASRERAVGIDTEHFCFVQSTFEEYTYPENSYDLVNGQFAFSFIHPKDFHRVMNQIKSSLKKGGIITGQIFGDKDDWNILDAQKTFLSKEQFDLLFSDFDVLKFEEEDRDKETALGKMKHWHTFHFIVRKK